MAGKPLEEEESTHSTGFVLKDNVYQSTFDYRVHRSVSPWRRVRTDSLNAAKLLMRPLPLGTLLTALVYSAIVGMVSVFIWLGWFDSFAVSQHAVLQKGHWWRLFSAQFQHADSKHLLNNLLPFFGLGWILWGYFGLLAFPVVPVLAGALANLIAVMTYPPHTLLVGLSGTVFAMAGLWSALYVKNDFRFSLRQRILRAMGFNLVLFFPLTVDQNISDRVHVLGYLCGCTAGSVGWGPFQSHMVSASRNFAEKVRVR